MIFVNKRIDENLYHFDRMKERERKSCDIERYRREETDKKEERVKERR